MLTQTPTDVAKGKDPVQAIALASSNLENSVGRTFLPVALLNVSLFSGVLVAYWSGLLGMTVSQRDAKQVSLGYADNQAKLVFVQVETVTHETAFGRVAFACPTSEVSFCAGVTIQDPFTNMHTYHQAHTCMVD